MSSRHVRRGPGPSDTLVTPDRAGNVVGIDPHKRTLTATIVDPRGGLVASEHFRVSGDGHRALEAWALQFGAIVRIGVEGASAWGRHTAVFLVGHGYDVRDVCPNRTAQHDRARQRGKSDTLDSERIARETLAHPLLPKAFKRAGQDAGPDQQSRPPTPAEQASARRIGRALSTAGVRERAAVRSGSVLPPGRLRMRGARAADAQRAAGMLFPTAEPFVRTTRTPTPTPPLRVGIACDVSGSMRTFADPVASAAWILAHAARHAHLAATSATVIFGSRVRAITRPGTPPPAVTTFEANDGVEQIAEAIDALDGALDLAGGGAARLLVIVSDGCFRPLRRAAGQARVDRLRAAGCGVLWLTPPCPMPNPSTGPPSCTLADPAATAQAIAHAATTALRTAGR